MILLSIINFRVEDNDLLRNLDLISMSIVTFQRALQINGANFVANMSDYSNKKKFTFSCQSTVNILCEILSSQSLMSLLIDTYICRNCPNVFQSHFNIFK